MAAGDPKVPTLPPITRTLDYGALVSKAWGNEWHIPETAYRFSNGRTFRDSGANGGIYGTGT
jgi:hypothetical protein